MSDRNDYARHTPGPWQCDSHREQVTQKRVVMAAGFDPIALVHNGNEHALADAKLIAAAPDLFAACNEAIEYLSTEFNPQAMELLGRLSQAAQKAEGKLVVHATLDTSEPEAVAAFGEMVTLAAEAMNRGEIGLPKPEADYDWAVTCAACSQEQHIKGDLPAECPQCGANMMSLRERQRVELLSGMLERGELIEWFCQPEGK